MFISFNYFDTYIIMIFLLALSLSLYFGEIRMYVTYTVKCTIVYKFTYLPSATFLNNF